MNISLASRDNIMKCGICNKPLSVPPIFYSANWDNICGRCENQAIFISRTGESLERQNIYESIATYLTFPCAYQVFGCTQDLKWDSVSDHENFCEFKKVICPLSHKSFHEQCKWVGEHSQLGTHIKKNHKSFFFNPPELMLAHTLGNKIIFCEITGRVVVIILFHHKIRNTYYCCIAADFDHQECLNYKYQVEIYTSFQWEEPLIFQRPQLEPLYGNTSARPDNSLKIEMDNFKNYFGRSMELKVKFVIVKKTEEVSPSEKLSVKKVEELDKELLSDLECPVCIQYMTAPIFCCENGHSVCGICSPQIPTCPICRGKMPGARNYALERRGSIINYPCAHRDYGCPIIGPLSVVTEHQIICANAPKQCLIDVCVYEGTFSGLISHIGMKHMLIKVNTVIAHYLPNKFCPYFVVFDNRLFILCIRFDIDRPFEYLVQCFDSEGVQYKYELQIIGSSLIDITITFCNLCKHLPFTWPQRANLKGFTGASVPFIFLSQFVTRLDKLEFKLKIERVN